MRPRSPERPARRRDDVIIAPSTGRTSGWRSLPLNKRLTLASEAFMRKELPALLVLAVSLSACSFSYSSSRSLGKQPGDASGAQGSGKPAKHAAPAKDPTPAPEPTAKNDTPDPAATPPTEPAPAAGTAALDPNAAKAPAAGTATLDPNAVPATNAGAAKANTSSTTLSAGKAPPPKSGPTKGPITAK